MPNIRELIEQRRDFLRLSYRELSDRAARAGFHVKYQTIQALASEAPREWPKKAETIKGLAEALDVPEQAVVLSFARSFGLEVKAARSRLESLLPSDVDLLPLPVQDSIAQMVRALLSAATEESNDGTPTSNDPPVTPVDFVFDTPDGTRRVVEVMLIDHAHSDGRPLYRLLDDLGSSHLGVLTVTEELAFNPSNAPWVSEVLDLAARNVGTPSRGQQLRTAQDEDAGA